MNKVVAWLKSIRLERILTVFMAGILVFVSTACSGQASAKTPSPMTADQIRQEVPESAVTNIYEGGMNDYSDLDPRKDTTEAQAKAKGLVENVQKNIDEKSIDSPGQYVENYRGGAPLGERVQRIGENAGEAAKSVTGQAAKGAQENVQSAQEAAGSAKQSADKTANAAQSKVKSDINNTQRTLDKAVDKSENVADAAQSKVKSDIKNTQRTLDKAADKSENLGDKIKQAGQDAADAVKDTLD
jgi:hypothetical protein